MRKTNAEIRVTLEKLRDITAELLKMVELTDKSILDMYRRINSIQNTVSSSLDVMLKILNELKKEPK